MKKKDNPLEYYKLLGEYHQYQELMIKEFDVPNYHFSNEGGIPEI